MCFHLSESLPQDNHVLPNNSVLGFVFNKLKSKHRQFALLQSINNVSFQQFSLSIQNEALPNICMVRHIYMDKMRTWDLKMCIHARTAIWIFCWEHTIEISEGVVRFIAAVRLRRGKTHLSVGTGLVWRLICIDIQCKTDSPTWSRYFKLVYI